MAFTGYESFRRKIGFAPSRAGLIVAALVAPLAGARAGDPLSLASPTETAFGVFGIAVAVAPDANGDGTGEVLVGATGEADGSTLAAGAVHVFSGAGGALVRSLRSPDPSADGGFGAAIAATGDVSSDGRADHAVGAPSEGTVSSGRVHLFSGADGTLLRTLESPNPVVQGGFGHTISGLPDASGDGIADLLVGAPREETSMSATDSGAAYLISGANGATLRTIRSAAGALNGRFGWAVAGIPDASSDGVPDLLISAIGEETAQGPAGMGIVYLHSGSTGNRLRTIVSPRPTEAGGFGHAVAGVRDVNGDELADFAVGAPFENADGAPAASGVAYVFAGSTGAVAAQLVSPNPLAMGMFGAAVASVPDADGDGFDDVLVGAPGESAGRAYLFSSVSGALLETFESLSPESGGMFGASVAGGLDLDEDGAPDFVAGAPFEDPGASPSNAGRAHRFPGAAGQVSNLSTRGFVGTGDQVMIAGVIVAGSQPVSTLVSAIGPDLDRFGVPDTIDDPSLALFQGQTLIATNDNWMDAPNAAAILATGSAPNDPLESAILMDLPPGEYTAIMTGANAMTGNGLVQIFDAGTGGASGLRNLSTRGFVGVDSQVLIAGVIVAGDEEATLVIRGLGPTLEDFGVSGALANPQLTVVDASQQVVASNDDWMLSADAATIDALGLDPPDPAESAVFVRLAPGNYTAILSGVGGSTGNGLVEVYRIR